LYKKKKEIKEMRARIHNLFSMITSASFFITDLTSQQVFIESQWASAIVDAPAQGSGIHPFNLHADSTRQVKVSMLAYNQGDSFLQINRPRPFSPCMRTSRISVE
jgi:DNA-directed RNA polymerase